MRIFVLLTILTAFIIHPASADTGVKPLRDSTYTFGAFDKASGKRLTAIFKIYFKSNTPIVIQGTMQSDVQFKPAVAGLYEVEISMIGYTTRRIPLNLENLGAGKTNFKEMLEPALDEFIILVTDARDKQIITTAQVRIKDEAQNEAEAKVNPKTGEWLAKLNSTQNYTVTITASGYMSTEIEIQAASASGNSKPPSKFISISLYKNNLPAMAMTTMDAVTKETIAANYRILRPEESILTGQSDKDKPFKIELDPKKKFTIEVSAEGYKTLTEEMTATQISNANDVARIMTKQFALHKDSYKLLFRIIDAQSKENIINTRMRIINLKTKQSIAARIEKEGFSANLSPDTEYSVEVESEGYDQANQNLDLKEMIAKRKFEHEILLVKKTIDRYRLIVVDEETNKNVPGVNLRIFNAKNEPITIQTTAVQSEWTADLKIADPYIAEIKMQGYLPYRESVAKNSKILYLKIRKVPPADIYFMATDFYTKNILKADYKLSSGNTAVEGSVNPEKTRFRAALNAEKNYQIEVVSDGYPPLKEAVSPASAVNNVITVQLKKADYSFTFNAIDAANRAAIPNVRITLTPADTKGQVLKVTKNVASLVAPKTFDLKFVLRVQADKYKPYTEEVNLMNIAVANFTHEVLLEKPEPAPMPQIEKTPPVIVEAPPKKEEKPAPPKEQPVSPPKETPKPIEAPKVAEAPKVVEKPLVGAIASDYFRNVEVGKGIQLENVFFDQSQPVIKPESYPELDKLVGLLKTNPDIHIEIVGHTDNVGDPRMNLYLSELRARAVSNYLFNKGIAPGRLISTGKGQQQPLAANDTEENRSKNRRVEFIVLAN